MNALHILKAMSDLEEKKEGSIVLSDLKAELRHVLPEEKERITIDALKVFAEVLVDIGWLDVVLETDDVARTIYARTAPLHPLTFSGC